MMMNDDIKKVGFEKKDGRREDRVALGIFM